MSTSPSSTASSQLHILLTLSTSTPRISLSTPSNSTILCLAVHARRTGPNPITLCTASTPLDNGHHARHDGLFRGAFLPLTSITDPARRIQLHFSGFPNYGSQPDAPLNLLERDYLKFETVPRAGQGELSIIHEVTLERLFRYSSLSVEEVRAGEKFKLEMNRKRLGSVEGWWTWGALEGELRGKKFAKWELPDERGEIGNLMPGEKMPAVQDMEREGWVFSEKFDELRIGQGDQEEVVVEFVE